MAMNKVYHHFLPGPTARCDILGTVRVFKEGLGVRGRVW